MKNAMKKLMAFVLVAVMLVGMVPFAASADECHAEGEHPITIQILKDGEVVEEINTTLNDATAQAKKVKYYHIDKVGKAPAGTEYSHFWATSLSGNGGLTDLELSVKCGDVVKFAYKTPEAKKVECPTCGQSFPEGEHTTCTWAECPTCGAMYDTAVEPNGHACPTTQCPKCNVVYYNHEGHGECGAIDVVIKVDGNVEVEQPKIPANNEFANVENLIKYFMGSDWKSEYTFSNAWNSTQQSDAYLSSNVNAGELIYIALNTQGNKVEDDKEDDKQEETAEYIKLNIYVDGSYEESKFFSKSQAVKNMLATVQSSSWDFDYYLINNSEVEKTNTDKIIELGNTVNVYFEKHVSKLNSNKVYLHVFMNNDFDDPVKNINITNGIAKDGLVKVNGDVKTLIKEYFSAKDSDGIGYDGLYVSTGDWAGDFLKDDKREVVDDIVELKEEGYVHLNIMITNAKLKSSSTADSTNPKTADNIYAVVTIMTASAAALAVAFYLNKKRAF